MYIALVGGDAVLVAVIANRRCDILIHMTRDQLKEILDRVLAWPADDQERLARVVQEIEELRSRNDITDEEWKIIEARAARRDLVSDSEVEGVFVRYRNA